MTGNISPPSSSGRRLVKKYKNLINFAITVMSLLPQVVKRFLWSFFDNSESRFAVLIRYAILASQAKYCGENVYIGKRVILKYCENLSVGANVSIHANCYIDARGGVEIGSDVSIAHSTSILSFEHTWADVNLPIKYNDIVLRQVKIASDVWIGCGAKILSGVILESRSVVAAGAVVTKNVSSNTLVGGVPAKLIKDI